MGRTTTMFPEAACLAGENSLAKKFEQYSSCDVSDALARLGKPHGGFIAGPTLWSPERQAGNTKIVGPAYTVEYAKLDQPQKATPVGHYIDAVPAGSIIVISAPSDITNAVTGSLMSTRAQALKAVGTVVDGRIRDLAEHRSMGYPLFATDVGTSSPYGVVHVVKIDDEIEVGMEGQKVVVKPRDCIVGDLNGVVCVPLELVDQVLAIMESLAASDARIAKDLREGLSFEKARAKHRT